MLHPRESERGMRLWIWLVLLLGVVFALGGGAAVAQDEGPIKIGAVFAITGPASWLGAPEANMAKMIEENVNAEGGVQVAGGKKRLIQVIIKDTQGDNTRTVNAVKELLRENVVAIIGPSRSGTSMAVAPICEEEKIPLISCAALAQIVEPEPGKVRYWVFKTPQRDDHVVERICDYMKAKGMKKIALITGTDEFGKGGRDKLKELAPKYGIEIVADETYAPADTDMTAQLTKIKAKNPDAVVNWSIVPAQSIMMKNMKQLEIKAQLFQSHGFGNYNYLKAAGDAAEGVIFPAGRALVVDDLADNQPQKAKLAPLKKQYEEKYKEPLSTFAGHAYDALWLVLRGIKKNGATRQGIRDYIETCDDFIGTGGLFKFSPTDHTGLQKDSLEMLTVKDGKFRILKD